LRYALVKYLDDTRNYFNLLVIMHLLGKKEREGERERERERERESERSWPLCVVLLKQH